MTALILHFISFLLLIRWMVGSFRVSILERMYGYDTDTSCRLLMHWWLTFFEWLAVFALAMLYTLAEIG